MITEDDSIFVPRYLSNIDSAIATCSSPKELMFLQARRAGYLARHSCPSEAKNIIRNLRESNITYDPRLTGWITLSEGLIPYFESLDNQLAKGKFSKALLMARIAEDRELAGIAAAWLANSQYATGELTAAVKNLEHSFELSTKQCTDARGRACLLLGDMLYWCGKPDAARHWYRESRKNAVIDGDIAMQNIILFNTANYAVWALNIEDCKSPINASRWRMASLEVASAKNLNSALRIYNLPSLIPNMEAELKVTQGKWQEADNIFAATLLRLSEEGLQRSLSRTYSQRAWCRVNIQDYDGAKNDISNAFLHASDCEDLDDLFVMHSRLTSTFRLLGDEKNAGIQAAFASDCFRIYETQQREILALISPILNRLTQKENPA